MPGDDAGRSRLRRVIATINELPIDQGILGGVGAFAGGYGLFTLLVSATGNVNLATPVQALKETAFLFYNAMNVPLVRRTEIARVTSETDPDTGEVVNTTEITVNQETFNLLLQSNPSLPLPVYLAIPALVLFVVGIWLTVRYVDPTDYRTSLAVIGGVGIGFVLAAMAGTFLAVIRATEGQASETLGPSQLHALGYGLAYPLLVTGLAVFLVLTWHRSRQRESTGVTE